MYYNDEKPPKVFNVITSKDVHYNADFIEYLIKQEVDRRKVAGEPALSTFELEEFRRQLLRKVVIHADVQAGINLRPTTTRKQLNG